jgi:hypothetical protein
MDTDEEYVGEDEFWSLVELYDPSWLTSASTSILEKGIVEQIKLPSGDVQVCFYTTEQPVDEGAFGFEDNAEAQPLNCSFVCTVAFDQEISEWAIVSNEEPTVS